VSVDRSTERILIVAPIGRDADLICTYLERAGMTCLICENMEKVCNELPAGAGALVFTDEALSPEEMLQLSRLLYEQPPWSEVPIIILTGLPSLEAKARSFRELGRRTNITLVDRPVRIPSLVSAAQSALKARQRQYEVRELMLKLEDRVHERDRFLAILGHELRNPLSAILLASQMTGQDGKLDHEHARLIERQSRHLTRLVNDLLDLSRVVSGKIVLKKQLIDLRQIVRQCLETLRESRQGRELNIELRDRDGALRVLADPVRAEQIVSNVLTNAMKYTPDGGTVTVTLDHKGGDAIIRVEDDGVGIAPERIGTIFELFAQAENAIGRAQGGMGIGLALVRNLVELHGGSISASSDGLGKGSVFTIRLPIATEAAQTAEESKPASPPNVQPQTRSIVIVEDNADVRELLGLKLRKLGHDVASAIDGPDGVERIVEVRPDLALIDIGLPGFDGYEVAARVRSQLSDHIVLVAVSGFGQPEDKRRALEAGFDEHLTKPADVRDIEDVLNRFPPRNSGRTDSVVR
jgi:signal transduction histidine kinase/ActR/RegA family two-component response regulator